MFILQETIECIFLRGHGCLSGNYSERYVNPFLLIPITNISFFMHQQQGLGNFIFTIYELPPNLIRFSNINIEVILQCSAVTTNLPYAEFSFRIRT